jgi:sigma54-dependent transcription regulator
MTDNEPSPRNNFLFPRSKYWGEFTPQQLAFNANLQEFAQRVSFVCNLETGGKMSADAAYDEIKRLWKDLKKSKANLIDAEAAPPPELPPDDPQS